MSNEPTPAEVGHDLARFSNYRVLRTQQLCQHTHMHASVLMALGLRETSLQNICGGAVWEDGKWVQSYTDRGCFQISEQVSDEADWLATVPGCKNGAWSPTDPPSTALEPMHVPRFTDAAVFAIGKSEVNRRQALAAGVKEADVLRFTVAAHNAGFSGALTGYREGDVDKHTAHGDYSAWVMKQSYVIHDWVVSHPAWVYHGQQLLPGEAVEF